MQVKQETTSELNYMVCYLIFRFKFQSTKHVNFNTLMFKVLSELSPDLNITVSQNLLYSV